MSDRLPVAFAVVFMYLASSVLSRWPSRGCGLKTSSISVRACWGCSGTFGSGQSNSEFSVLESSENCFCFLCGVFSLEAHDPVSDRSKPSGSDACFLTLCALFKACCLRPSSILQWNIRHTINYLTDDIVTKYHSTRQPVQLFHFFVCHSEVIFHGLRKEQLWKKRKFQETKLQSREMIEKIHKWPGRKHLFMMISCMSTQIYQWGKIHSPLFCYIYLP